MNPFSMRSNAEGVQQTVCVTGVKMAGTVTVSDTDAIKIVRSRVGCLCESGSMRHGILIAHANIKRPTVKRSTPFE